MPTQKSIISASEGLGSGYALSRESAATPFMAAKRRSVFDSQGQAMTQWSGLAAKILPCAWWRHQCLISTHIFLLCVFMLSLIFLYCCYIISKKWKKNRPITGQRWSKCVSSTTTASCLMSDGHPDFSTQNKSINCSRFRWMKSSSRTRFSSEVFVCVFKSAISERRKWLLWYNGYNCYITSIMMYSIMQLIGHWNY